MSLSLSWQDRVIIHTILTFDFDTPPPTIPYHQPSDPHKDLLKGHLHQESWSWSRTSSRVTCHCYASEEAQSSRDGFGEAQTAVLCIYTLALRRRVSVYSHSSLQHLQYWAVLSFPKMLLLVLLATSSTTMLATISVPNSSDGLIFFKRRALDVRFLDKNAGFRGPHRRARFTFLISKLNVWKWWSPAILWNKWFIMRGNTSQGLHID